MVDIKWSTYIRTSYYIRMYDIYPVLNYIVVPTWRILGVQKRYIIEGTEVGEVFCIFC